MKNSDVPSSINFCWSKPLFSWGVGVNFSFVLKVSDPSPGHGLCAVLINKMLFLHVISIHKGV